MKKRWKLAIGLGGLLLAAILVPIAYIETACRGPSATVRPGEPYRRLLAAGPGLREEARTWLTYPEWHIVYSAESYGRFLDGRPPSAFPYFRHIGGFWSSYCALNKVASGSPGTGEAKVMIYTIGISYTIELGLKGLYEKTIGRIFEWTAGSGSVGDAYSAGVQQRYGEFMHQTPWYEFPFGDALRGLWATRETNQYVRNGERRVALSVEYGTKAGYAALIGWASGSTLGPDERTLRMLLPAGRYAGAVDPRIRIVGRTAPGLLVAEVPRYAQLTDILGKLAASGIDPVEIAGNDDIFVTVIAPASAPPPPPGAAVLLSMPTDDRPGWRRLGLSTKVVRLGPLLRAVRAGGGEIEHVYDY
ncbi:MAG TPA: hypothetical protein VD846_06470 [Allosphingosinicella sp.]|nr:hypothetical protein [Allosphingosinicella sp.]